MGRGLIVSLLFLLALVGSGAALHHEGQRRAREPQEQALAESRTAAAELGRAIDKTLSGADAEARTLADSKTLRAAVATDAGTLRDMVARDVNLAPRPDETIEILQLAPSGPPLRLLRLPENGLSLAPGAEERDLPRPQRPAPPALLLRVLPDGIAAAALYPVVPPYRRDELIGLLALTVRLDLGALRSWLMTRNLRATLEGPGGTIELGAAAPSPLLIDLPVPTTRIAGVKLHVFAPVSSDGGLGAAGLVLALLGLLGGGALLGLSALRMYRGAAVISQAPVQPVQIVPVQPGLSQILSSVPGAPLMAPPPAALSKTELPPEPEALANTAAYGVTPRPGLRGTRGSLPLAALHGADLVAGKYRLLQRIGAGGMAEVYLAQALGEASFEKRVAIKVLMPGFEQTLAFDHFLAEAVLQAKVSHPHVVQIYDLGKSEGTYFIAMEYVEGLDASLLNDRLIASGKRLPLRCALTIAIAACEGLHAAHTAEDKGVPLGLIHRDVKPSNILVGRNGSVKVADFGIAKATRGTKLTIPGQVKGSLAYMAPEQRTGGDDVDRRADVFGMGAVLYELCTGTLVNLDLAAMMVKNPGGWAASWPNLKPPSQVPASDGDIPAELDAIIFRALSYQPAGRQSDCRILARELEALLLRLGQTPSASVLAEQLAHLLPPRI